MPGTRADRTDYLGLLALMQSAHDTDNWSFPYWNQLILDAALYALAQGPRDGTALPAAPTLAPTYTIAEGAGALLASGLYDLVQTFVDEWGRETDAGPIADVDMGDPITDPVAAATFGAITNNGANGYEGGLLEIWYSWTDGAGGETLPSPVAQTDIPYLAGGDKSSVVVILPSTPAVAGAAGANVYLRHRGGPNVVLAYRIETDSVSTVNLVGAVADCYRSAPLVNSTYASKAISFTGRAGTADTALTRFYLRPQGAAWAAGDRRICIGGVDEWDPAVVTYPLVFTGEVGTLAPGYPPTVSQVKAVRPIDLATEVTGILDETLIDAVIARDLELVTLLGGPYVLTGLLVEAQVAPDMTVKSSAGWAISDARIWNPGADTSIAIAAADASNPRIDLVCVNTAGAIVSSSEDAALKGLAAGSPAAPSTPAHYVKLAEISVPALDTTIGAAQITDSRVIRHTLDQINEELDTHVADATAHGSKPYAIAQFDAPCGGSTTYDFTVTIGPALMTKLDLLASSGGTLNFDFQLYENIGRSVLAYSAAGIATASFIDAVPWEWFEDGGTMYGRVTNNSADAITQLLVNLSYRR